MLTYGQKVQKLMLNPNATESFTCKEIAFAIVNLQDAYRVLSQFEYTCVKSMFDSCCEITQPIVLNQTGFFKACDEIIAHFDLIAPYYKYCGDSNTRIAELIDYRKKPYRLLAKKLIESGKIKTNEWMALHDEFLREFYS